MSKDRVCAARLKLLLLLYKLEIKEASRLADYIRDLAIDKSIMSGQFLDDLKAKGFLTERDVERLLNISG